LKCVAPIGNMKTEKTIEWMEELDDNKPIEDVYRKRKPRQSLTPRSQKRPPKRDQHFIRNQDDKVYNLHFTYKAARFEESWLLESLGYFYEQGWISDVLRKVKAGKEASVYLCRSGEQVQAPLVAAKVYRPRMLRNLRDDHLYREGREVLDEAGKAILDLGMLKAQHKRTVYGEQIRHQSWIAHEFTALQTLFEAGADVPCPYEMAHNSILMGYLGDERLPAPILNDIHLTRNEAGLLFERVLHNLHLLLACERVHGDLSAYNILYWEGAITLIDFPQVISPHTNRSAYPIFKRDVSRLCEYFCAQGLSLQPGCLAADLWQEHGYRLTPEIHPRLLEAEHE
jgi:RIO kinase 1